MYILLYTHKEIHYNRQKMSLYSNNLRTYTQAIRNLREGMEAMITAGYFQGKDGERSMYAVKNQLDIKKQYLTP